MKIFPQKMVGLRLCACVHAPKKELQSYLWCEYYHRSTLAGWLSFRSGQCYEIHLLLSYYTETISAVQRCEGLLLIIIVSCTGYF